MNLIDFYDSIIKFDLNQAVAFAVTNTSEKLEDLQREQFMAGMRGDGTQIGDYTEMTARYKEAKGQPFDHVTLKDTGSFHAKITIFADRNVMTFTSTDVKTALIEAKYGESIWGFAPAYQQQYQQNLYPLMKAYYDNF